MKLYVNFYLAAKRTFYLVYSVFSLMSDHVLTVLVVLILLKLKNEFIPLEIFHIIIYFTIVPYLV